MKNARVLLVVGLIAAAALIGFTSLSAAEFGWKHAADGIFTVDKDGVLKSVPSPYDQDRFPDQLAKKQQPEVKGEFMSAAIGADASVKMQGQEKKTLVLGKHKVDALFRDGLPVSLVAQDPKVQPTLSPDNKTIAVYYRGDNSLTLYDVDTGKTIDIPMVKGNGSPVFNYWGANRLWDKSGKYLYFTGSPDGISRLYRVQKNGEGLEALYSDREIMQLHGWSSNGSLVVNGGPNSTVLIIAPDGTYKDTGNFAAVSGVISPSGKLMITAPGMGPVVELYDFQTSETKRIELPGTYNNGSLGWAPSEKRVATFIVNNVTNLAVIDLAGGKTDLQPLPSDCSLSLGLAPSWLNENTMLVGVLKAGSGFQGQQLPTTLTVTVK